MRGADRKQTDLCGAKKTGGGQRAMMPAEEEAAYQRSNLA